MDSQLKNPGSKGSKRLVAYLVFIALFAFLGVYLFRASKADTGTASTFFNSPTFMRVGTSTAPWANISALTRYPSSGTYDVSNFKFTAGQIGLKPDAPAARGVAVFYWTSDVAGDHIVGVQGMNLASLIVSQNQLRMPNQGPYLYVTYKPYSGTSQLSANLFSSNVGSSLQEIPGDTILIDDRDKDLAARSSATIYPDDYFAGPMRVYLSAPAGVTVTIHGDDLTDQFWPLDSMGPGSMTTIAPMGTWIAVVTNNTGAPVKYTLSMTPSVTGTSQ